jgi:DNA-binding winged helix-turn-helix (wHTH) protein
MKRFDCFGLDTANQCLLRGDTPVDVAPKPFAVLRYLVENSGRLITHDELLNALWPETYVQSQVLRTYMLELRKVLGDDAANPRFIQTLPKRGYRFVAIVTERAEAGSNPASSAETAVSLVHAEVTPIVGREEELSRLKHQLQLAESGQRQVVFVTGDPGIGKTALVDAFCFQPAPEIHRTGRGRSLARGQCVQGVGVTEEYYPVTEALSQLCASPDGQAARQVLTRMAPGWLAPCDESSASPLTPPANRERTLGDLCSALEELAAQRPLILILEDLHWADESTLNLISALARRRASARLILLATFCSHFGSIEHPLKALKQDLLLRRLCLEIELAPLKRTAVSQFLIRKFEQDALPAGLADFVYQRSEGNPLFVIAVVEHLIAERVLVRKIADGKAEWEKREPFPETEAGVPDQLVRMIELAIERLSEQEQRLLEAASLMNVAFPAWAVAAALELDPVEAEEACDALSRRLHFVLRAGQDELPNGTSSAFYVFAHGIYREVLYRRQTAARRARRHIRIAERLGQLFAGREAAVAREMSMHYEAAGDHRHAALVEQAAAEQGQPFAEKTPRVPPRALHPAP